MVLIIDDSNDVHDLLRYLLPPAGWQLLNAWSGEEGIAQFQRHRKAISVVLLDLQMPGMGGVATFDVLRALAPTLPIIIFTAMDCFEARRYFPHHPSIAVLEKTCGRAQLLATLNLTKVTSPQ